MCTILQVKTHLALLVLLVGSTGCLGKGDESAASPEVPPSAVASVLPIPSPVASPAPSYGEDSPAQTSPMGITAPVTWYVASDINAVQGLGEGTLIGNGGIVPQTAWSDRSLKQVHSIIGRSNSFGILRLLTSFSQGLYDAVLFCKAGTVGCANTVNSQLSIGPSMTQARHFLQGADKVGASATGGSSFTVVFVAARASVNPLPMMDNRDAVTTKAPFLGWIGNDLKFAIHGSAANAVTAPTYKGVIAAADYDGTTRLKIYTAVYSRAQKKIKLYVNGAGEQKAFEKPTATGDGPDNNLNVFLTMGGKTAAADAKLHVLEQVSYSRALTDSELCEIHRHLNAKYHFNIGQQDLKPCL